MSQKFLPAPKCFNECKHISIDNTGVKITLNIATLLNQTSEEYDIYALNINCWPVHDTQFTSNIQIHLDPDHEVSDLMEIANRIRELAIALKEKREAEKASTTNKKELLAKLSSLEEEKIKIQSELYKL
jgi:hypothetical protein